MRNAKIIMLSSLLACCLVSQPPAAAQVKISQSVFGSGGATIANGNNQIIGTVGQAVIGQASNSNNISRAGFWYQTADIVTSVAQIATEALPEEFRLQQNYPNPFNPSTTIRFAIPEKSEVTLKLFNILGREVAVLVAEELEPGEYKVVFEAEGLPSGVYLYRIQAQGFVQTRKLTLLK